MARILSPRGGSGPRVEMWTNAVSREFTQINMSLARAYLGTSMTGAAAIADDTPGKVLLDTESWDIGANFAAYKYVLPVSGYYQVNYGAYIYNAGTVILEAYAMLYQAGVIVQAGSGANTATAHTSVVRSRGAEIIYGVKDDYLELYAYGNTSDASAVNIYRGSAYTYMSVHLISLEK